MDIRSPRLYEVADLIASVIEDSSSFEELAWESPDVDGCLTRFSKTSLLGHYVFTHLSINDQRVYRKHPETVNIDSIERGFQHYEIRCMSYREFLRRDFAGEQDHEDACWFALHPWMSDQEEAFCALWERIADEVFHLLFGNRSFLLNFNLALAEFRRERGDSPSKRCFIPQWVKRAVYFRENGKCALCKKDLSGLIAIDPRQHYDHMVPLKRLGANDPCNMQLLCDSCNLQKAASRACTSTVYDPWWR